MADEDMEAGCRRLAGCVRQRSLQETAVWNGTRTTLAKAEKVRAPADPPKDPLYGQVGRH